MSTNIDKRWPEFRRALTQECESGPEAVRMKDAFAAGWYAALRELAVVRPTEPPDIKLAEKWSALYIESHAAIKELLNR